MGTRVLPQTPGCKWKPKHSKTQNESVIHLLSLFSNSWVNHDGGIDLLGTVGEGKGWASSSERRRTFMKLIQ
jgi:hypothetical protein